MDTAPTLSRTHPRPRRRTLLQKLWSRRTLNTLFSYLILTLFAFLTVFPFLWMVVTTFKSRGAIFSLPPTLYPDLLFQEGMFNSYTEVLTRHNFLRYSANSLFVATMAAIGQLITASLAGFAFARMKFRGSAILFGLLLSTTMIPVEVSIIPEFVLMARLGWLDSFLPLIVPSFLVGSFGTFMLREFFATIPDELVEAAVLDGASTFRIYKDVFLPVSLPAMTTLFLIAFIHNWNELLRPVLYITTPSLRTVTIGLTTFQGEYGAQWNLLLAGAVVSVIPLLVIYISAQRYVVEGIATTGIK
ncbi:MAG TPA: carbohydrate ABC transporter permease [Candidatus Sulfomarinibacteraceae bacterium]|nr:carbohydrate ABC transporter permease [Candidatus Sulfomarinibacteraceae bacterium]